MDDKFDDWFDMQNDTGELTERDRLLMRAAWVAAIQEYEEANAND